MLYFFNILIWKIIIPIRILHKCRIVTIKPHLEVKLCIEYHEFHCLSIIFFRFFLPIILTRQTWWITDTAGCRDWTALAVIAVWLFVCKGWNKILMEKSNTLNKKMMIFRQCSSRWLSLVQGWPVRRTQTATGSVQSLLAPPLSPLSKILVQFGPLSCGWLRTCSVDQHYVCTIVIALSRALCQYILFEFC